MNPMIDIGMIVMLVTSAVVVVRLEWPRISAALDDLDKLEADAIRRQIAKEGRSDG